MTANSWTDSGKPIPYPDGMVTSSHKIALSVETPTHPSHGLCGLCGMPADETWDGVVMCGECEGEMAASARTDGGRMGGRAPGFGPSAVGHATRTCCECGDAFTPRTERMIRCGPCQVASDFG